MKRLKKADVFSLIMYHRELNRLWWVCFALVSLECVEIVPRNEKRPETAAYIRNRRGFIHKSTRK
jgi:adenylate kinase